MLFFKLLYYRIKCFFFPKKKKQPEPSKSIEPINPVETNVRESDEMKRIEKIKQDRWKILNERRLEARHRRIELERNLIHDRLRKQLAHDYPNDLVTFDKDNSDDNMSVYRCRIYHKFFQRRNSL